MGSVKQQTLSGVKWTAIEKFSVQGIHFLLGILMARLLTPADFGAVAMLGVFIALSNTFISSGFGNALIRKLDRTDVDYSTVFYFNLVISLVCVGILLLVAPSVARFYNMPILCPILRVQCFTLILHALCIIQTTRLTIKLDFRGIAMRSFFSAIISGVAGVVMAYVGLGVWALVYQAILANVINVIFLWTYTKWHPILAFSWKSFREMFGFGSRLLGAGLIDTIYRNLSPLVIGKFFSPQELGYYNRGTHFARFPSTNIYSVLQKVSYPVMARIQNDNAHLIAVYHKYIRVTCMVIFFACTLLAAVSKPLILLVLTEKWAVSIIYLQVYCFAAMFSHISVINLSLLKVKGRSGLVLRLEIIKKALAAIILFSAIPFGVLGICVSKVIYAQIALIINTYYTGKFFGLGYIEQIRDFAGFFVYSVLACLPAFFVAQSEISSYWSLLFGLITAPMIYWLFLRKNELMKETLSLIGNKLPFHRKNRRKVDEC